MFRKISNITYLEPFLFKFYFSYWQQTLVDFINKRHFYSFLNFVLFVVSNMCMSAYEVENKLSVNLFRLPCIWTYNFQCLYQKHRGIFVHIFTLCLNQFGMLHIHILNNYFQEQKSGFKNRYVNQWNKIKEPSIGIYKFNHLILGKDGKKNLKKRIHHLQMILEHLTICMKNEIRRLFINHHKNQIQVDTRTQFETANTKTCVKQHWQYPLKCRCKIDILSRTPPAQKMSPTIVNCQLSIQ